MLPAVAQHESNAHGSVWSGRWLSLFFRVLLHQMTTNVHRNPDIFIAFHARDVLKMNDTQERRGESERDRNRAEKFG